MNRFEYTKEINGEQLLVAVPVIEKLGYLLKMQPYFDCTNPEHMVRPETLRLRMQTITQSYHLLDSALYVKMKPIAEALEDKPDW